MFFRAALIGIVASTTLAPAVTAQALESSVVPQELMGQWKVVKQFNTQTISCWSNEDAKKVLGTTVEYGPKEITWRNHHAKVEGATVRTISAESFAKENSSPSVNGSQIGFKQLKIAAQTVKQVTIQHAGAEITGSTVEFPGDEVLLKSADTLVFSLCNLYFEARRVPSHRNSHS